MATTICTATGVEFDPFSPRAADIRVEDIAHALARICRFGGHTRQHYSVAQHSVHVFDIVKDAGGTLEAVKLALMHDAAEAYGFGDMPAPLKHRPELAAFAAAEKLCQRVILATLGIAEDEELWRVVKHADLLARDAEQAALMPDTIWWTKRPAVFDVVPWPPDVAHSRFLRLSAELGIG